MYSVTIFNKLLNYSFNTSLTNTNLFTLTSLLSCKYNKLLTKVVKS